MTGWGFHPTVRVYVHSAEIVFSAFSLRQSVLSAALGRPSPHKRGLSSLSFSSSFSSVSEILLSPHCRVAVSPFHVLWRAAAAPAAPPPLLRFLLHPFLLLLLHPAPHGGEPAVAGAAATPAPGGPGASSSSSSCSGRVPPLRETPFLFFSRLLLRCSRTPRSLFSAPLLLCPSRATTTSSLRRPSRKAALGFYNTELLSALLLFHAPLSAAFPSSACLSPHKITCMRFSHPRKWYFPLPETLPVLLPLPAAAATTQQ